MRRSSFCFWRLESAPSNIERSARKKKTPPSMLRVKVPRMDLRKKHQRRRNCTDWQCPLQCVFRVQVSEAFHSTRSKHIPELLPSAPSCAENLFSLRQSVSHASTKPCLNQFSSFHCSVADVKIKNIILLRRRSLHLPIGKFRMCQALFFEQCIKELPERLIFSRYRILDRPQFLCCFSFHNHISLLFPLSKNLCTLTPQAYKSKSDASDT